ncbi:MAG: MBG domain-containing protein [Verrucomicrobiota bacterium]
MALLCSLTVCPRLAFGDGGAQATAVVLWDPSTDPTVTGYNVYYGAASGNYTNVLSAGNTSEATVSNLVPGVTYYFAVTACNVLGMESDFSNEASYLVPPLLVVTADNQSRVYGTANGVLTGSLTGVRDRDDITASFTTTADASSGVGTYPIVPVLNDPAGKLTNYTVSVTNGVLTVIPAPLTVQANNQSRLYGQANPAFTATCTGFVNGDTPASLSSPPVLTTPATAADSPGNYPIHVGGAASPNYALNFVDGTLTILPAASQGLLTASTNPALPGQPVTFTLALSAVAPGAGTPSGTMQVRIDGAAAGGPVPLSGGAASYTASSLAHGRHTVAAEYAGDANFGGVTNVLSPAQVINTPPVAGPITLERGLTNGVKISIADLLTNDSDADGDLITLAGVNTTSANGGTVVTNSGWIFYTPAPGFTNTDTFTYTISDGWGAPVTGVVTVNMSVDTGPSRNLAISNLGNGSFAISGSGIPGRTYIIQYTTNSPPTLNWQTLGTTTADTFGSFVLVDAGGSSLRFYRAVYP